MHEVLIQQRFFDDLACEWDQINGSGKKDKIEEILHTKIPPLSGPVLDVGSGTGILVPLLSRLIEHHIFELDVARKMLKTARYKLQNMNHHSFVHADAHQVPFADRTFGTVFCFCVYPHFYNPGQATREIHRVLKSGGRMIVLHLMNHQELNAMHASKNEVVAGDVLPQAGKLAERLETSGFRIVHCEEASGLYLVIGEK